MNLPCSLFIKMHNFGPELQKLCKQMHEFLKAAIRNTCISHSLDKHEQTYTMVTAKDGNGWFGNHVDSSVLGNHPYDLI